MGMIPRCREFIPPDGSWKSVDSRCQKARSHFGSMRRPSGKSLQFLAQGVEFLLHQPADAVTGEVNLGATGAEAFLYLVHAPALHGAEVEDLIIACGDHAADSEEGALEEVVAPFFVPQGVGGGVGVGDAFEGGGLAGGGGGECAAAGAVAVFGAVFGAALWRLFFNVGGSGWRR